jgi:hypothetical protein
LGVRHDEVERLRNHQYFITKVSFSIKLAASAASGWTEPLNPACRAEARRAKAGTLNLNINMNVSQRTLIITAAIIWYGGGISLLFKGGALIKNAYALDPQSMWTYMAPILGIIIGLLKGRFLFSKSCEKNTKRIKALTDPRIWQCFRPGMLIFLAIIMPTGAWMSRAAAGNYPFLCLVGALDLSIACALLSSSIVFWKRKAFSSSSDSGNVQKKEE